MKILSKKKINQKVIDLFDYLKNQSKDNIHNYIKDLLDDGILDKIVLINDVDCFNNFLKICKKNNFNIDKKYFFIPLIINFDSNNTNVFISICNQLIKEKLIVEKSNLTLNKFNEENYLENFSDFLYLNNKLFFTIFAQKFADIKTNDYFKKSWDERYEDFSNFHYIYIYLCKIGSMDEVINELIESEKDKSNKYFNDLEKMYPSSFNKEYMDFLFLESYAYNINFKSNNLKEVIKKNIITKNLPNIIDNNGVLKKSISRFLIKEMLDYGLYFSEDTLKIRIEKFNYNNLTVNASLVFKDYSDKKIKNFDVLFLNFFSNKEIKIFVKEIINQIELSLEKQHIIVKKNYYSDEKFSNYNDNKETRDIKLKELDVFKEKNIETKNLFLFLVDLIDHSDLNFDINFKDIGIKISSIKHILENYEFTNNTESKFIGKIERSVKIKKEVVKYSLSDKIKLEGNKIINEINSLGNNKFKR